MFGLFKKKKKKVVKKDPNYMEYWSEFKEKETTSPIFTKVATIGSGSKVVEEECGRFIGYSNLLGYDHLKPGYKHKEENTHQGKKFVEITCANQEDFDKVLEEVSPDLRAISIFKCPKIHDFSGLERFPNLEYVQGYWNNKARGLWNASKTPKITELHFQSFSKLNAESLSDFTNLRDLLLSGDNIVIRSFDFLKKMKELKQFYFHGNVLSNDIRPLLELSNLENYYIGKKYHKFIERYQKDGFIPAPSVYSDMPTRAWLEDESTAMNQKQIKAIEKILGEYSKAMATTKSSQLAGGLVGICVTALNQFAGVIETEEREQLYEFILSKGKDEWSELIEEVIDETRDW